MNLRSLIPVLACLALLGATTLGAHAHVELGVDTDHHHHGADSHEHREVGQPPIITLASDLDPGHFSSHLQHGDVDIESKGIPAGKTVPPALLLGLLFTIALLLQAPALRLHLFRRRERPAVPPWPHRFLPPSHAPPAAA